MTTLQNAKNVIDLLTNAERLVIMEWLASDYCAECGAAAYCDCPECVCECRKRLGRELKSLWESDPEGFKRKFLQENRDA